MIRLNDLSFSYPDCTTMAISNVTGCIGNGINLLLGENGAGKTTLMHLIAGLLSPRTGSIDINGMNPTLRHPEFLRSIFFITDNMVMPFNSIDEFVKCHACFYPTFNSQLLHDNLSDFGFSGSENLHSLSLGNRRKSILAYALALGVDTLLLDEPANGLDISSKQALQKILVRCVDENQTVLISTHTTSDFECLFDNTVVISRSHLLLSMPTWRISRQLTFISGMMPPSNPLYLEQRMGLFKGIIINDGATDGRVDFEVLYNALLSPAKDKILKTLEEPDSDE